MIKDKEEKEGREVNLILHNIPESGSSEPEERKNMTLKASAKSHRRCLGSKPRLKQSTYMNWGRDWKGMMHMIEQNRSHG